VPPSSELYVSHFFETVLLRVPVQRRLAAQQRQPIVGNPLLPDVEVGQVDVLNGEPLERRAGDGGLPGHRLGDMVFALVDGLRRCRRGCQPHEHDPRVLARLVDRQRVEGGRGEHVPGADVELRAVAGAHDDGTVQLTFCERALLVRARVIERDPVTLEAADTDSPAVDVGPVENDAADVLDRADRVPRQLIHRGHRYMKRLRCSARSGSDLLV